MKKLINIVVVGCGNIGLKRVIAMKDDPSVKIKAIVEISPERREFLKRNFDYLVTSDFRKFLYANDIEAVIISTHPEAAYLIILDFLNADKHVLCEKPLGKCVEQARKVTELANKKSLILKNGFNLRHEDGLKIAANMVQGGRIGSPYFFKCTYVNGCVLVNTNKVGSLLDMGTHTIDLARWFMGEIETTYGKLQRYEYHIKNLDDNGFAILESQNVTGIIHFSLVRWCNAFNLEITGEKGTIYVQNLTKWGKQSLIFHRRVYPSGIPDKETIVFEEDNTWKNEWKEFYRCVKKHDMKWNDDGLKAMLIAQKLRESSEKDSTCYIDH